MKNCFYFSKMRLLVLLLLLSGCSAEIRRSLIKEDKVDKEEAVLVLSIHWYENYTDLKKKEKVRVSSDELDASADLVRQKSKIYGENELLAPLYYISEQRFDFRGEENRIQIEKYAKSLRDYEDLGIYRFIPDAYELSKLYQKEQKLFVDTENGIAERWKEYTVSHTFPPKKWKFEGGKIYYLGKLELFFRTQKKMFGLFPPSMVNKNTTLVRVRWSDDSENAVRVLKERYPWFPTGKMINVSQPSDEVYSDYEWSPFVEKTVIEEERGENLFW